MLKGVRFDYVEYSLVSFAQQLPPCVGLPDTVKLEH